MSVPQRPASKHGGCRLQGGGGRGAGFTYVQDGSRAVSAARRKQLVVVLGAVGLATPLKEGAGANLLLAVTAEKVLWVPRLPQRVDHLEHETGPGVGSRRVL